LPELPLWWIALKARRGADSRHLARKACRPDAPIATRNDPQKSPKDQKDITKQPGFIGGKSHKSINPDNRFNFINAALCQNEEGYWKAFEKSAAPMKAKLQQMGVEMTPALFNASSNTEQTLPAPFCAVA